MKFVFAPDSFKGSLSALKAAQLLREAAQRVFPGCTCVLVPVADGGEGTAEAMYTALGGEKRVCRVTGPLGERVDAMYVLLPDGTAVIEMAQASGLPMVPQEKRNPLYTTSRGTGELMLRALSDGAKSLLIGLGGSATNDGGIGMLSALGARFLNEAHEPVSEGGQGLESICEVDLSGLDERVLRAPIRVMCDVTNPLLGETGATHVYGPQKGATEGILERLEKGMTNYASVCRRTLNRDIADFPGAGAAGGLGAALGGILGGRLERGIDAVLSTVRFEELLKDASLCVTGEGRFDGQSIAFGKVVGGIADACKKQGVPMMVLTGGIGGGTQALYEVAEASILPTVNGVMTLEKAMNDAESLFADAAERMMRTLRIGMSMR